MHSTQHHRLSWALDGLLSVLEFSLFRLAWPEAAATIVQVRKPTARSLRESKQQKGRPPFTAYNTTSSRRERGHSLLHTTSCKKERGHSLPLNQRERPQFVTIEARVSREKPQFDILEQERKRVKPLLLNTKLYILRTRFQMMITICKKILTWGRHNNMISFLCHWVFNGCGWGCVSKGRQVLYGRQTSRIPRLEQQTMTRTCCS